MKEERTDYEIEMIREYLEKNDKGQPKQSLNNCTIVLREDPLLKGALQRNMLMGMTDITREMPWHQRSTSITDTDINNIRLYMEKNYSLSSDKNLKAAIDIVANENTYHPVAEKLESLAWDGKPRIATALNYFLGAEINDYNAEVLKMHMEAAIHRVFHPGCKYDICMVLVGNQGGGKSTFLRFMAINDEWFTDDIKRLSDDKVYQWLQGHWFVEMSEMSAASKSTIEEIKAFLSRQKDNYRIPYESKAEDRPRQCVVCGTSNDVRFLPLDRTGNRRFAPVLVNSENAIMHPLDDEKFAREYFLQMWAEAMVIYRDDIANHRLRLTFSKEMEAVAIEMQRDCMKEDVMYGRIETFLDEHESDKVCCAMIAHEVFGIDDPKKQSYDASLYTEILRAKGWKDINSRKFYLYGRQKAWIKIGGPLDKDAVIVEDDPLPIGFEYCEEDLPF